MRLAIRRALVLVLVLWYWAAGFYPFKFAIPGASYPNVAYQTHAGLSFPKQGIAYTDTAPPWVEAAIAEGAFNLELDVLSYDAFQDGSARIFTVSRDHYSCNLTVAQRGRDLELRLRRDVASPNGAPAYIVPAVFKEPGPHRILVRVGQGQIRLFVDGREKLIKRLIPSALATWDPDYRLALGNEFTFQRPWRGEVRTATVRVGSEKFPYPASSFVIPSEYTPDPVFFREKLVRFLAVSFSPRDWLVNLFGFLPFGFFLGFGIRDARSAFKAVLCCAALSLSIEFGQLFFEPRTPALGDFFLNTVGGAIGAWGGVLCWSQRHLVRDGIEIHLMKTEGPSTSEA